MFETGILSSGRSRPATSSSTVVQQTVSWALDSGGRECELFLFSPQVAVATIPETLFPPIPLIQTGRTRTYPNLNDNAEISASKLHQDEDEGR